jgi:hypothetical protein
VLACHRAEVQLQCAGPPSFEGQPPARAVQELVESPLHRPPDTGALCRAKGGLWPTRRGDNRTSGATISRRRGDFGLGVGARLSWPRPWTPSPDGSGGLRQFFAVRQCARKSIADPLFGRAAAHRIRQAYFVDMLDAYQSRPHVGVQGKSLGHLKSVCAPSTPNVRIGAIPSPVQLRGGDHLTASAKRPFQSPTKEARPLDWGGPALV